MTARQLLPTSLTGRIVLTTVVLVTLVSALIAVATTIAIRSHLTNSLDEDVRSSSFRAAAAFSGDLPLPRPEVVPPDGPQFETPFGQGSGTITARITDQSSQGEVITADGHFETLSSGDVAALATVSSDDEPHTVDLPNRGSHRVIALDSGGALIVTGLPTTDVDNAVSNLLGWALLFTVLGVTAAGVIAYALARRQLRPLREVAQTAHEVAELPLDAGRIGVTARVPGRLADEANEVGEVGSALNTLLGHMERALDARHQSEQQVRQFVADASHELRTPLATICGYAELSTRNGADVEQMAYAMSKVESETERMWSLVDDLLLLARLDAGRPLETHEVDLSKLVVESVADARMLSPERGWVLNVPRTPVVVLGDEGRLHQVVTNLLTNARRHTPAGTIVKVSVSEEPGEATVAVRDDGQGIPPELQDTVFERFTRGDASRTRDQGGAGLGLSLARAIVKAHSGRIELSSRPGSTTFTVSLPKGANTQPTHR